MADMAWNIGPIASVLHILRKLSVIFGTVASFDVLMQNFYKVTQGNNEKVLSFSTKLKETLNQIRLQCPSRMMDLEVQQHLKDCLFHGVCKHICDYIWYLYRTPRTSYSQGMVATCKAESENVEILDNVRARAVVATDPREGMAELGQQISKLMATLTKAEQGNNPTSAPAASLREAMGGDTMVAVPPVAQIPIMAGVALDRLPQPTAYLLDVGQGALGMEVMDRVTRD